MVMVSLTQRNVVPFVSTCTNSESAKGTPDPDREDRGGHEEGTQIGRPIVDLARNP